MKKGGESQKMPRPSTLAVTGKRTMKKREVEAHADDQQLEPTEGCYSPSLGIDQKNGQRREDRGAVE